MVRSRASDAVAREVLAFVPMNRLAFLMVALGSGLSGCSEGTTVPGDEPGEAGVDAAPDMHLGDERTADVRSEIEGDAGRCVLRRESTLPHVHIEFGPSPCVFTLAQAAAGISIPYDVV